MPSSPSAAPACAPVSRSTPTSKGWPAKVPGNGCPPGALQESARSRYPHGMLGLPLLRHAKSRWHAASLDGFARPLAPRGEAAAPRMGAYMAAHGINPQLILCSAAQRTRQTLALILPHLAGNPTVELEDGLYLATAPSLLARIRK